MAPRIFLKVVVCGLLAMIVLPERADAAQPARYIIDPARSELVVQLFKAGFGAAFAHDHVVRATKYVGRIQLDPAVPADAQIAVDVDATALVADDPEIRRKYDLDPGLSEEDRREIQQTLESEEQLDVRRYSMIRFRSTRITPEQKKGRYTVTGDLTLRGVTQSISLSLQAALQDGVLRAKGSGRVLQSRFGYQPYSAFLGAVKNQDEVVLQVDIVAVRQ